ncbi:cellulose biosynthesis protein BcsS [Tardiphaga alba]|nr:cellulose biosynthesis protein BcsS [Tardiphaga alba]
MTLLIAGLSFASSAMSPAIAQVIEIDGVEIDVEDLTSRRQKTFWELLTDNRANRKQPLDVLSGGMPDKTIYFAGVEASQWSVGVFGGGQWMPNGINRNGFILRMFMSESIERYTNGRFVYDTQIGRASILPGYQFRIGRMDAQFLLGPDAEVDFFFHNGRANRWRTRFGMRGLADIWWEPTPYLMLQSTLSATTIDNGYTARIAPGWRVSDWFWIGPEATFSSDFFSEQTRFGAHITGLRMYDYEWSLAAGRVTDNFGREGFYGRFGIMLRPRRAPFFDN